MILHLCWDASGSICWCNAKQCAKCISCVFRARNTEKSHSATWTHRNLSDLLRFGCHSRRNIFLLSHSLCLFLHFSYLTHSLGSCALHPCSEARMIPESLHCHKLLFPGCQTGQRSFLPRQRGQLTFALAWNMDLFRTPRGPMAPNISFVWESCLLNTSGFPYYANTISL